MGKALSGELSCMQTGLVTKGNNICGILFASLNGIAHSKWGLFFKERICSYGGGNSFL